MWACHSHRKTYLFIGVINKNSICIFFKVMYVDMSKHICVADLESLHEHFFNIIAVIIQNIFQTSVHRWIVIG